MTKISRIPLGKTFIFAFALMIVVISSAAIIYQSQIRYIRTHDQYASLFSQLYSITRDIKQNTFRLETAELGTNSASGALAELKQSGLDLANAAIAIEQGNANYVIAGMPLPSNMPDSIRPLWNGRDGLAQATSRFSERLSAMDVTQGDVSGRLSAAHRDLEQNIQPRLDAIIRTLNFAPLDRTLTLSTAVLILATVMVLALGAVGIRIFRPMRRAMLRSQLALSRKVDELAKREADAQHNALHDALTGLPNRRAFTEQPHMLAQASSDGQPDTQRAIALVDLDRFKQINDTLGHHAGDAVLVSFAERLGMMMPEDTLIARLGGDEFALVFDIENDKAINNICARIIRACREPVTVFDQIVHCGVSVGAAIFEASVPAMETLRRADLALNVAKTSGRNCYRIFVPEFAVDFEYSKKLQDDLRNALKNNEIHLVYQPIVSHDGKRVLALEALMRWEHPTLGAVPPTEFIQAAEESGQIRSMGAWALRQAMLDTKKFNNVPVAFNLSPVQLRHHKFLDEVLTLARETDVNPANIEFEITESVLIDDAELARTVMRSLKAAGFSIALDDFGTGYSSFGYLRNFPFDKLKIDRSFVSKIDVDPEAAALVDAMINIGRALNINVVAEGVETEGERRILQAAGCAQMQGYLFCKPELVGHVQKVLSTQSAERAA